MPTEETTETTGNDESSPEDLETSDWTQVVELNQKTKVKPLSIDILAPTSIPHNIPYLEVYRTDELYAKDYVSPFMTPPSTSTNTDGTENTGSESDESGEDNNNSGSNSSSNSNNSTHDTPHSSKTKNQKLSNELKNILKRYYKSTTNFKTLVNRYMGCKTNKVAINVIHIKSYNNLKKGADLTALTNAVLKVKRKYS